MFFQPKFYTYFSSRPYIDPIYCVCMYMRGVGLRPLDCWNHGFESRLGHGCSSVVFVVCCVGSGLCDEPITRSEESYSVCVCNFVWYGNLKTMRSRPDLCCCATGKKNLFAYVCYRLLTFSVVQQPKSGLDRLFLRFLDHTQLDTHTR